MMISLNQSTDKTPSLPSWRQSAIAATVATLCCVASPMATAANELAGKTIIARGGVHATQSTTTDQRKLKRRSPIYDVDVVKTDAKSKTQLRMVDGGMISLKENSELVIAKYEYDATDQSGSVALELVKGGLRSITGAIKAEKGNYQLTTPVGSIGIRGTHYEIELIGGLLFIAVWDGAIDVSIDVGTGDEQSVSLGTNEDYSYASVDEAGTITPMLEPPTNFEQGHSSDPTVDTEQPVEETETETASTGSGSETTTTTEESPVDVETEVEEVAATTPTAQTTPEAEPEPEPEPEVVIEVAQEAQEDLVPPVDIGELVLARTGTFTYNQISNLQVASTAGATSNFSASMTVNFDNATIPTGNLSFNDAGGEWFAAFNGIINVDKFEMDVNFASHGNNLADGDIDALFLGDLSTVQANFNLFEINNNSISAQGSFRIR